MKRKFLVVTLITMLLMIIFAINVNASTQTIEERIEAAGTTPITITLEEDCGEEVRAGEGQDVTVDLAGHKINALLGVYKGKLTIKDSVGGGSVNLPGKKDYIDVNAGTFVLESGTINTQYWGLFAGNGGKVIINGGEYNSVYSPLTGNNNNGAMFIEVNGGTVNAQYGPAIYMPAPGSIKVTGGTLNGGIISRLGDITISGGTINAVTKDIDAPKDYYDISGTGWFPEALLIWGGTYIDKTGEYGNDVNINITGGTFNCANDQGSAVAIYDLGKVEQEINVNISGDAVLTTKATDRTAYEVLDLEALGVTSPKSGYGKLPADVTTNITGGTFSSLKDEYLDLSAYGKYKSGNNYVIDKLGKVTTSLAEKVTIFVGETLNLGLSVTNGLDKYLTTITDNNNVSIKDGVATAEKIGQTVVTSSLENGNSVSTTINVLEVKAEDETTETVTASSVVKDIVTDLVAGKEVTLTEEQTQALQEAIDNGETIVTDIKVEDLKVDNTNTEDKEKVEDAVSNDETLEGATVAKYFDINVVLEDEEGNEITTLTKLPKAIKITVSVPTDIEKPAEGAKRTYFVIRVHDGKVEKLPATYNEETNTVSFESDSYSTYALGYVDTVEEKEEDKKDDGKQDETLEEDKKDEVLEEEDKTNTNSNPQTGDTITLYVSVLLIASIGAYLANRYIKKNRK